MKTSLRIKADKAKEFRCKDLIVVLENPKNIENIGSTIRNVESLGAEKLYVIDGYNLLPQNWNQMRNKHSLNKISASAIKWTYVRKFQTTDECIDYLKLKKFDSVVTSPHLKGRENVKLEDGKFTQKRLAVWFGNESIGISPKAVDNSIFCVNMTMAGIIESLNLGTSTGIVLYEITKQRREFNRLRLEKKISKHANQI